MVERGVHKIRLTLPTGPAGCAAFSSPVYML
jgi:hypothetical protein